MADASVTLCIYLFCLIISVGKLAHFPTRKVGCRRAVLPELVDS